MNSDSYQKLATRTEPPYSGGWPSPLGWVAFVDLLTRIRLIGEQLDPIKKHMFYGMDILASHPAWNIPCNGTETPHVDWTAEHWRLAHGLIGKATELAELIEAILPYIGGSQESDIVNIAEEIGDSRWYDAIIAEAIGISLGRIDERNIAKLEARFGSKFTAEQANMRDLLKERAALEGGTPAVVGPSVSPATGLSFGHALVALKAGLRVRRSGWNGKGMWLALTPGAAIDAEDNRTALRGTAKTYYEAEGVRRLVIGAHIDMRAADGSLVIGWLASQTDMLADDWEIVSR